MLTPQSAAEELRKHFAEVTPQQFRENLERFCPEILQHGYLESFEEAQEVTEAGQSYADTAKDNCSNFEDDRCRPRGTGQ